MMRAGVVILNWNGWGDTVECLESVFRLDPAPRQVVVCDNGSTDGSVERIRQWAEGRLDAAPASGPLRRFTVPPVAKPVGLILLDRVAAETGSGPGGGTDAVGALVLIRTGGNLGFAGGNNVGLRYLLKQGDIDCVWLLNNDTVVPPESLGRLMATLQAHPDVGMVGSTLLYYDNPDVVQALGGCTYNRWLGMPRPRGLGQPAATVGDAPRPDGDLAYVSAASLLVRRALLEDVGLMAEHYFLYYEELDWVARCRGRYGLAHQPHSIVYHKEGASIGSAEKVEKRSLLSDYYSKRNRVRFACRHRPVFVPTVILGNIAVAAWFATRGDWARARVVLRATLGLPLPQGPQQSPPRTPA